MRDLLYLEVSIVVHPVPFEISFLELVCPICEGLFYLRVSESRKSHIVRGSLCGHACPVCKATDLVRSII